MSSSPRFLQRLALRRLALHPVRSLVCVGVIAAGVALFVAVKSVGRASLGAFTRNLEVISGDVAFIVTAGELGFRESVVEELEEVEGVARVNPVVETQGRIEGREGPVTVVGIDLLRDDGRRREEEGQESLVDDPLTVVAMPDSVLVPRPIARGLDLDLDSPLRLRTARGEAKLTVRGIFWDEGASRAYGGAFLIMDIDAARMHFGKRGKVDRVDVVAEEGADLDALEKRLRERVGDELSVARPELGSAVNERAVGTLSLVLGLQSLLALFAGAFLVFNLMSIAAAERRRETGMLRAIGARRPDVGALYLLEALPLGLAGALLGLLLGRRLAALMMATMGGGIVGTVVQPQDLVAGPIPWQDSAIAFAMGLLTTAAGCALPAIRASRTSPLEALSRSPLEAERGKGLFRYSGRIGIGLLAASAATIYAAAALDAGGTDAVGHALAIAGFLLWTPSLVATLTAWARAGHVGGGIVSRLALEQMLRNPRRTGSASAALVIGIVLVVVVAAVGRSFERSALDWYMRIFRDDLLVSGPGELAGYRLAPMHESLLERMRGIPGVSRVHGLRFVRTRYEGRPIVIKAYDPAGKGARDNAHILVHGGDADRAFEALFDSGRPSVLVSENFRRTFGKGVGDTLVLPTPFGRREFPIAGIVTDYASPVGVVAISRAAYRRIFADPFVTVAAVGAARESEVPAVREAALRLGRPGGELRALTQSEIRGEIVRMFREGLSYTRAIEAVALLIAFLALFSHFLMSVSERGREIGVLRAVGATRAQVTRMVLTEAVIQGLIAGLAALALSAAMAAVWVRLTLSRTWGWELEFHFPWTLAAAALAGAVMIPAAAAAFAARRAASTAVIDALSVD